MKKIVAICGMGFGSSFIVEMNIKNTLKELGVSTVEVDHMDLGSAYEGVADLIVCGEDLVDNCKRFGEVMSLRNLFDKEEMKSKLEAVLKEKAVL